MNGDFEFDFEEWAELAKRDLVEFDRRRDLLISGLRARADATSLHSIDGICWRIDIERQRCTTPLQLSLKLYSLMWDRHCDLYNRLLELNEASQKYLKLLATQRGENCKTDKPHLSLVKVSPEEEELK